MRHGIATVKRDGYGLRAGTRVRVYQFASGGVWLTNVRGNNELDEEHSVAYVEDELENFESLPDNGDDSEAPDEGEDEEETRPDPLPPAVGTWSPQLGREGMEIRIPRMESLSTQRITENPPVWNVEYQREENNDD